MERTNININKQYLQKLISINNDLGDDLDIGLHDDLSKEIHKDDFSMQMANTEFFKHIVEQFIIKSLKKEIHKDEPDQNKLEIFRDNLDYLRKPIMQSIIEERMGHNKSMEELYKECMKRFQAVDEFIG
jgi:hypothetical protein